MIEVRQTETFAKWRAGLKDIRAVARIDVRIRRLSLGHFGDAKTVGGRVSELRIDYGPGYRIYFTRIGDQIVVLLCAGSKARQNADIRRAQHIVKELDDDT